MKFINMLGSKRLVSDINVVPYIDVMLVLLVVFMVATPLLTEGVYVDLPQADGETINTAQEKVRMVVSIDENGQIFISTNEDQVKQVSNEQLRTEIAKQIQRNTSTDFYVKGDRKVPYGQVVTLMATLQTSGVANVGLITQAVDIAP